MQKIGPYDTFPEAQKLVEYDLRKWIREMHNNGWSYRDIATALRKDRIIASHETVRAWAKIAPDFRGESENDR